MQLETDFEKSVFADTHISPVSKLLHHNYSLARGLMAQAEVIERDTDLANEAAAIFEDAISDISRDEEKEIRKSFTNQALTKSIEEFNQMPDVLRSTFLYNYIMNNFIIPNDKENPYHYKLVFDNINQALVKFTACVDEAESFIKEYKKYEKQHAECQPYNTYNSFNGYDVDYTNIGEDYWENRLADELV